MPQQLDGPRIEPRGSAPTALVVLLHGYGANGDDLIALADGWQGRLPQAVFLAPDAPESIPGMPEALQWFPLTFRDPAERWRGVVAARPGLDRFLDTELSRYRLGPDRLVLAGFSQGTTLALHVGLRRSTAPAAIVGYSGLLGGPEHLGEIVARPPVLLIHGEADDLIPVDACTLRESSWPWPGSRSSGTCAPGSATASILRGNASPRTSWPRPSAALSIGDSSGFPIRAGDMAAASHPGHTPLVCRRFNPPQ